MKLNTTPIVNEMLQNLDKKCSKVSVFKNDNNFYKYTVYTEIILRCFAKKTKFTVIKCVESVMKY